MVCSRAKYVSFLWCERGHLEPWKIAPSFAGLKVDVASLRLFAAHRKSDHVFFLGPGGVCKWEKRSEGRGNETISLQTGIHPLATPVIGSS